MKLLSLILAGLLLLSQLTPGNLGLFRGGAQGAEREIWTQNPTDGEHGLPGPGQSPCRGGALPGGQATDLRYPLQHGQLLVQSPHPAVPGSMLRWVSL